MNVLLIDPPWVIKSKKNLWRKVGSCLPSLGLVYIAAVLEREGHKVDYIDSTAENLGVKETVQWIIKMKEEGYVPELIGITSTTTLIDNATLLAKDLRKICPSTKIVFGGTHPTVLPEECLIYADYVVIGEGEYVFSELAGGKDLSEIKGLVYKDETGKVIFNEQRMQIDNLDVLPLPAYHLLSMEKYRPAVGTYKQLPAMSMISSRNCNGRCTYCFHLGKRVTFRSAENIIKEVELLYHKYGIREIQFYDDNFLLYKQNVFDFCSLLKEKGLKITWSCFSRVDAITRNGKVDLDYLKELKKAGLHLVLFGVETADLEIMKNIKKNLNLNDVKPTIDACREAGIETRCSYMFGNEGETEESCEKTINFAIYVDSDTVQFNIATAYPGTEFYEWAKSKGLLLHAGWENFNMSDKVIELPTISNERLNYYYTLAHRKFYLRPRVILRRAKNLFSLSGMKQEFLGLRAVIGV
ncbi:MAG: B12-binding domain-containing radical SAM protein [Candidatus Margulisbacteria bacterium]|nr:B12-binding domain-containing radical SAM protein [Candidatus Margulisiibacteriota bacterium]